MQSLKVTKKSWNKTAFGNVDNMVVEKQQILPSIQSQIEAANVYELDSLLVKDTQAHENLNFALDCQVFFEKKRLR